MTCPLCHSTERFGVRLPSLKAAILDRIRRAGDEGVSSIEIIADLYRDRGAPKASAIKSHVNQINDLLAATDWAIRSDRRRWFLCQEINE